MNNIPKVTVGIPTYNRPDGLLRTIQQITSQTYSNLEIIISNNASTNPIIKKTIDYCAQLDSRIKPFHQQENIGLVNNFKFVLKLASSDFFMWAADDDEWDINFIDQCMIEMQLRHVGTVMPGFMRHNRALNVKGLALLPKMTGEDKFSDAVAFYETLPHSMFYGLHRKETISWFLQQHNNLMDDEYLIIRQILLHGIFTMPEKILYCAGIDSASYEMKLPKEANDRYYFVAKRITEFNELLLISNIEDKQKIILLQKTILSKLKFILGFESEMRQKSQIELALQIFNFLNEFDINQIENYTNLIKISKLIK